MLKQINTAIPLPKYYQISESIKANITGNKYKVGEKLPTCRALSEYFDTTLVTVSNAIKLLESEGYIHTIQGKGMFVKAPADVKKADIKFKKVGLLMPIKTDLYQNIADVLIHTLEEFDYEAVPLGTKIVTCKFPLEFKEEYIKKYATRGFDSLVINGDRYFPYKLLHKYKEQFAQLNFIAHHESALDFPEANIITADYEKVGYLGGKHLLKQDKKRILFVSYASLSPELARSLGTRQCCSDEEVLTGIKTAIREAGLKPDIHIIRYNLKSPEVTTVEAQIKDFMSHGSCGIMAMGDSRALFAYHAARKLSLPFGEHCSIVGLFNTPWTQIFSPSLTSISINEREIGRLTAKAIYEGWKGRKIKVAPELIVRET